MDKEIQQAILQEKIRGIPDIEIRQKYGVTSKYIEELIIKSQGVNISSFKFPKKVKSLYPKNFKEEQTTVWSFKQRGNWATHSGVYRGNWSPYIPRNVILKYSEPDELILDYFCGAGTTAVECKLLGRKCIALDINDKAIELVKKNLDFTIKSAQLTFTDEKIHSKFYEPQVFVGDARNLSFLQDNSIDLICSHPPYSNIIHYTDSKEGDFSFLDIDDFLKEMSKVANESFRVLKPGKQCAILIGDPRRKKHVIPLGFRLMNVYLNNGFKLRELVIKREHNCKTTGFWYANSIKYNFLLLAHEYLLIFEKPILEKPILEKPESFSTQTIKEVDFDLITTNIPISSLKKKLDKPETKTVWIFPEHDFEELLNKNVIDKYSEGKEYSIITINSKSKNEDLVTENKEQKDKQLIFIKSPFLNGNHSYADIEYYLKKLKKIVEINLSYINKGGFLVIQTQDIRIGRYVEPLAKKIVDILSIDNLWLREIVIVTPEKYNLNNQNTENYLEIVHQYLLIYDLI